MCIWFSVIQNLFFINLIDSIFLLILDFIYFDLPLKCLKPPHNPIGFQVKHSGK